MFFNFIKWAGVSAFSLLSVSCISVSLKSIKDKPAQGVRYTPPPSPYKLIEGDGENDMSSNTNRADATWVNASNGNKISFYSNCSLSAHVNSLEQLEKDLLEDNSQDIKTKDRARVHQGMPARFLQMEVQNSKGNIYLVEMFFFKKRKCFYVLNWLAPKKEGAEIKSLEPNIEFSQFIKGFKVP